MSPTGRDDRRLGRFAQYFSTPDADGDFANELEATGRTFESLFSVKFCRLRYFSVFTRTTQPRRVALFVKTFLFYLF